MYTDETGEAILLSTILLNAVIGFAVSFATSAATQAVFNGGEVDWNIALIDGAFGAATGAVGALNINSALVGLMSFGLSLANGFVTTGIENDWQYNLVDICLIGFNSILSGIGSAVMHKRQLESLQKTNAFVNK